MSHGNHSKTRLREQFRALRQAMTAEQSQSLGRQLNQRLLARPQLRAAKCLAGYWPFDREPDIRPTLKALRDAGTVIALPLLGHAANQSPARAPMEFRQWEHGAKLTPGPFGILQPESGALIPLAQLDVILMPLLAWDRRGHRLGMGGGYYDRTLASAASDAVPQRIGVAWASQESAALPREPHDVDLHAIATEKEWFTCSGQRDTIVP